MGLDAYLYKRNKREEGQSVEADDHNEQLAYWRKYWQLQDFLGDLWSERYREGLYTEEDFYGPNLPKYWDSEETVNWDNDFNCVPFILSESDLRDILKLAENNIPQSKMKYLDDDFDFEELSISIDFEELSSSIDYDLYHHVYTYRKIKEVIEETDFKKEEVYYYSWW